jgi:ribosomal protein L29
MATTKKTTNIAAKKANEIKTVDQLREDLVAKTNDLLQARRGNAAGELTNPRIITVTRKEIARLKFAIHANELASAKEIK